MPSSHNRELVKQVVLGAREHGIGSVLFRHMIGERLGLNVTDIECLGLLFHKGLSTPTELARHAALTAGATTAMLGRPEKAGLLERRPNLNDRRGTLIAIKESGARRVGPWFSSAREVQEKLVSSYSLHELRFLSDFFQRSVIMWKEERD